MLMKMSLVSGKKFLHTFLCIVTKKFNTIKTLVDSLSESFDYNIVDYDPLMIDDPELTCGKHRKVLNLSSYTVRISIKSV